MYLKEINIKYDTSLGYLYFIDREHPLATGNSGRVYYHRHAASIMLGRWLTNNEHVHHKDGDRSNNIHSNLEVLSAEEHIRRHIKIKEYFNCEYCGSTIIKERETQRFCSELCRSKKSVRDKTITKEILQPLIGKYSWVSLGKMFGYSDVGIRKRAKALGCKI